MSPPEERTMSLECDVLGWCEAAIRLTVNSSLLRSDEPTMCQPSQSRRKEWDLMRSARTLCASAAITAVLTIAAPTAYAMTLAEDWGRDNGSSSSNHDDKKDDHGKDDHGDHGDHKWKHKHHDHDDHDDYDDDDHDDDDDDDDDDDEPKGSVDAGGGFLASVMNDEWGQGAKQDEGSAKDENGAKQDEGSKKDENGAKQDEDSAKDENGSKHEEDSKKDDYGKKDDDKKDYGKDDHDHKWKHKHHDKDDYDHDDDDDDYDDDDDDDDDDPKGSVDAGGGGLAMNNGSLAAGSLLMLGGIGAGAWKLRRRGVTGTSA
ncbi:hypothetical protein SSP531S_03580 [Streptomyces spongiicola]|uniref:Uncharacterized protein n=2 Tax=Streptomyces spongiicola TaxID=1690221 RepID=A0A388SRB2_9ACTN|nr:hypothetical protein SSP531S_03580 [Streptomyces spongiicola]